MENSRARRARPQCPWITGPGRGAGFGRLVGPARVGGATAQTNFAHNFPRSLFETTRKRCNPNDAHSMFEQAAGELRAKLLWRGPLHPLRATAPVTGHDTRSEGVHCLRIGCSTPSHKNKRGSCETQAWPRHPQVTATPPPDKFRMQFPQDTNRCTLKNRRISTIRFQYLKYTPGNCMRNYCAGGPPPTGTSSSPARQGTQGNPARQDTQGNPARQGARNTRGATTPPAPTT